MRFSFSLIVLLAVSLLQESRASERSVHLPLVMPQPEYKGHFVNGPNERLILYSPSEDKLKPQLKLDEYAASCANCKECCCGYEDPFGEGCSSCMGCWRDFSYSCDKPYSGPRKDVSEEGASTSSSISENLSHQNSSSFAAGSTISINLSQTCSVDQSTSRVHNCMGTCIGNEANCLETCPNDCSSTTCPAQCANQCNPPCESPCLANCTQSCAGDVTCIPVCLSTCVNTCANPCTQSCLTTCTSSCVSACPQTCAATAATCTTACVSNEVLSDATPFGAAVKSRDAARSRLASRISSMKSYKY